MADPNSAPTGYAAVIQLLERLPIIVHEKRRRERLSLRGAARQTGLSFSTILRCEEGRDLHVSNAIALLAWVGDLDAWDKQLGEGGDSDG